MDPNRDATTPSLAYCTWCLGIVPFGQVRDRLTCRRCGRTYRRFDPAGAGRRRAQRYLVYGAAGLIAPAGLVIMSAAAGPEPPAPAAATIAWALLSGLVALGCLGRALALHLHALRFETLHPWEVRDLERRLCPGMVRSDVMAELSRRGWRIGKIRSVLGGLRLDAPGPRA